MEWYLKKASGEVFGPVATAVLRQWAASGRIAPDDQVATDEETWMPAVDLPDLGLDWMVELGPDNLFGPFHLLALGDLIREGSVPAAAPVVHRITGERHILHEALLLVVLEQNARLAATAQELRLALESAQAELDSVETAPVLGPEAAAPATAEETEPPAASLVEEVPAPATPAVAVPVAEVVAPLSPPPLPIIAPPTPAATAAPIMAEVVAPVSEPTVPVVPPPVPPAAAAPITDVAAPISAPPPPPAPTTPAVAAPVAEVAAPVSAPPAPIVVAPVPSATAAPVVADVVAPVMAPILPVVQPPAPPATATPTVLAPPPPSKNTEWKEMAGKRDLFEKETHRWKRLYADLQASSAKHEQELSERAEHLRREELSARTQLEQTQMSLQKLQQTIKQISDVTVFPTAAEASAAQRAAILDAYNELSSRCDTLMDQLHAKSIELEALEQSQQRIKEEADQRVQTVEANMRKEREDADRTRKRALLLEEDHLQLLRSFRDLNDRYIRMRQGTGHVSTTEHPWPPPSETAPQNDLPEL
jgi:virulence-associated protein VapD